MSAWISSDIFCRIRTKLRSGIRTKISSHLRIHKSALDEAPNQKDYELWMHTVKPSPKSAPEFTPKFAPKFAPEFAPEFAPKLIPVVWSPILTFTLVFAACFQHNFALRTDNASCTPATLASSAWTRTIRKNANSRNDPSSTYRNESSSWAKLRIQFQTAKKTD